MELFLFGCGFTLAAYTQFAHLTMLPGLHYDEAWQGLLALRIAIEQGFWPTSAMNSYTTPVLHYLLAASFKLFGPSLLSMRATLAVLNLSTLALMAGAFWHLRERRAAVWFAFFWALLPLSVHNHRFFIEVTSFHGLCFALVIWATILWNEKPATAFALVAIAITAGTFSHILFVTVYLTALVVVARIFPVEFNSNRFRTLASMLGLILAWSAHRMAAGITSLMPVVLALALLSVSSMAFTACISSTGAVFWRTAGNIASKAFPLFFLIAIPFSVFFIAFLWNGFWPYAQMTGQLDLRWAPVNALLLAMAIWLSARRGAWKTNPWLWGALILFALSSLMIIKQTSRHYTITMIAAMAWTAIELARLENHRLQVSVMALFVAFNFWAFHARYVGPFESHGADSHEFRIWIFHDSARDFRPYQKAFAWLNEQGCITSLEGFESDRDALPFKFLQLTTPRPSMACEVQQSIGQRALWQATPALKLLAHFRDWGDLAYWIPQ